jgi:hypothetical protein
MIKSGFIFKKQNGDKWKVKNKIITARGVNLNVVPEPCSKN